MPRSKTDLDKLRKADLVAEVQRLEAAAEAAGPASLWPVARYRVGGSAELIAVGDWWALWAGAGYLAADGRLVRCSLSDAPRLTWAQASELAKSQG